MPSLLAVENLSDIPSEYRNGPIGRLLGYHNLDSEHDTYERAPLLVGTCMDHRIRLRMPRNFAYVLRTGGANLRDRDFEVSFAIAVGGVEAIALIGHGDCGMDGVRDRREAFLEGMVERAGWTPGDAEAHFRERVSDHEIDDAIRFTLAGTRRLRERYPGVRVAPLHYGVEDGRLYLVAE